MRLAIVFLAVVIVYPALGGRIPQHVIDFIDQTFSQVHGAHLFFCQLEDAAHAFNELVKGPPRYNVRHMPEKHEPKEILMRSWQAQKLGVFLDITCERGIHALKWSSQLFNTSYSWIIFSQENTSLELFQETRLSVDSEVRLIEQEKYIYEVFRFHESTEILKNLLAEWNDGNQLESVQEKSPRTDFGGMVFNASLMMIDIKFNDSNLLEPLLDKTYESGKDMVRRYGLSLFMHLAEMYNFSYNYIQTNTWGDPLPNGSFTGMVGQVMRGEAEFGLAPAKFLINRYHIIDYVISLHIVKACFSFLQPKLFGSAKALVLPLDDDVWLCLAGIGILSVLTFGVLSKYDKTGLQNDNLGGSCLLVVGAISQQGIPDSTEKTSSRIVYFFLLVVSFFTAAYYNTAILNGLLLPAPNAIQNIDQLLASDTKLGLVDIPYFHNEMRLNDSLSLKVKKKIAKAKSKQIYYQIPEGVKKMKKGQFALFTEDEAIYSEIHRTMTDAEICSLTEITKDNPFHVAAIGKHNGPYKEILRRTFTLMRERGVMNRQLEHWTEKKPECHWKQDALVLGIEPLALAYAVFLFGVFCAILCLGIEVLAHRRKFFKSKKTK